jgi:hypothetical protein
MALEEHYYGEGIFHKECKSQWEGRQIKVVIQGSLAEVAIRERGGLS